MEPNKERIKLWVEDLEHGGHKQVQRVMGVSTQDGERYCCLGRLCEVAMANNVSIEREIRGLGTLTYSGESGSYVPLPVSDWLGVGPYQLSSYAALNDGGATFAEIAAKIRKKYLPDADHE